MNSWACILHDFIYDQTICFFKIFTLCQPIKICLMYPDVSEITRPLRGISEKDTESVIYILRKWQGMSHLISIVRLLFPRRISSTCGRTRDKPKNLCVGGYVDSHSACLSYFELITNNKHARNLLIEENGQFYDEIHRCGWRGSIEEARALMTGMIKRKVRPRKRIWGD